MAVRFPNPPLPIDPIEIEINSFFDRVIMCVNARRMTLLVTAVETRNARTESLRRRAEGQQQLLATKGEIERLMKDNILQETQKLLLREVERKLEEVRTPLPETRVVFGGKCGPLEQLMATLRCARYTPIPRDETDRSCREGR